MKYPTLAAALVVVLFAAPAQASSIGLHVFHDRASYVSVLLQQGRVALDADWNEEQQGAIHDGDAFGIFSFAFDPATVQPAVAPGIVSGLAVGAAPDGRFKGDQGVALVVSPGLALNAFGVEIAIAPSNDFVAADIYGLIVGCDGNSPPCLFAGNAASDTPTSSLFLGVIADPGYEFGRVGIEAVVPRDASGEPVGAVPDWQIAAITTTTAVPEPSALTLMSIGLAAAAATRRRRPS